MKVFYIFPIKRRRVIFSSFGGKQISCNPYYIYKALEKLYPQKYECLWVTTENRLDLSSYENIRTIPASGLKYVWEMMTAKCIITNDTLPSYLNFRSEQLVINTWHGGGLFKQTFGLSNPQEMEYSSLVNELHNKDIKLYTISSQSWLDQVVRRRFGYNGETLNSGMPRNDIFFSKREEYINKIKEYFSIPKNNGIVLYAPTFRGSSLKTKAGAVEQHPISVERVSKALANKYGRPFTFIFRGHHLMSQSLENCIDASAYPDMQELLSAADIFISDYSSCLWDFSLSKRPSYIYAPDFDEYVVKPGFESDYKEWPFPIAKDNEKLEQLILDCKEEEYKLRCKEYHKSYGSYETGDASDQIAQYIHNQLT